MSQSCFARVSIGFKETPNEFKDETTLTNKLTEFHNFNKEIKEDISINIEDIKSDRRVVDFEMNSTRSINLEFQINLLIEYLKALKIKIDYFDSFAFISMDSCSMYIDEEEFDKNLD